jgi:redox-sensing transcriptional repressor
VEIAPYRTIGRLTRYWQTLSDLASEGSTHIYSHLLAAKAQVSAAQVRRDLMILGYTGTPARGYEVSKLKQHIEAYVFPASEQRAAIAGVGNIGLAILKYFTNPEKYDRLIHGCRCYSIENAAEVIREKDITVGVIAVPDREAQYVSNVFVDAGVRGILNFARTPLQTPPGVYVEDIDLAMSMDRVAFFARQSLKSETPTSSVYKESNS